MPHEGAKSIAVAKLLWYARAVLSGPDGEELSEAAKAYRATAPWANAVWRLLAPAGLGVAAGYAVDSHFNTKPWALLVGGVTGVALGFALFLMTTTKLLEKKK